MKFKVPRKNTRPEDKRVKAIKDKLRCEGWYVIKTHGNAFQSGLPDLYAIHRTYGTRWIEVKVDDKGSLTHDQMVVFNHFAQNNVGIYIMTHPDDYPNLFKPANWHWYLDPVSRKALFKRR